MTFENANKIEDRAKTKR